MVQVHTHPPISIESEQPTSILIVGGSLFSRIGIVSLLDQEKGFKVVGHASHSADIAPLVSERRPNVVVLNGEADPLSAIRALAGTTPAPRVLVLSSCHKRAAQERHRLYVPGIRVNLADAATLLPAVRLLCSGYQVVAALPGPGDRAPGPGRQPQAWKRFEKLTEREVEVLHLILRGWSNPEIAEALALSGATIKSHVHSLMNKLELRNRVDVITTAYTTGLVRPGVPATWQRRLARSPA